jgi:nitrogen fixation-related uncharacterized protein
LDEFADAKYMIANLFQIASVGLLIAGVHYCGTKFLLIIPGTLIPLVIGVVTNLLLWDAAHGQYEDSDTLIFGAPRVPGSADAWFKPAETATELVLMALSAVIVIFAVWPKNRPAFRLQKRPANVATR